MLCIHFELWQDCCTMESWITKLLGKTFWKVNFRIQIILACLTVPNIGEFTGKSVDLRENFKLAGIHVYQWLLNVFQAIANTIKVQTVHWMRKKGSAMSLECGHAFSGGVMGGIWCPKFNFFFFQNHYLVIFYHKMVAIWWVPKIITQLNYRLG